MDHRLEAKHRQDDKGKVVVSRHKDLFARISGVLRDGGGVSCAVFGALRVIIPDAHLRSDEVSIIGTNGDVQIFNGALGIAFIGVKPYDHTFGFPFDGRQPCIPDLQIFTGAAAWGAIAIQILAISDIIRAGRGIADAEAGGVLYDQPGVEQPSKFQQPNQGQHQDRQDQRKFNHALRLFGSAFIFWRSENIHTISFGSNYCEILVAMFFAILSKISPRARLFGA